MDIRRRYVDKFLESIYHISYDLPLIAFTAEDLRFIIDYLKEKKLIVGYYRKEENISLNCKHFPYTCREVNFEHDDGWGSCECKYTYHKGCSAGIMIYKTYVNFSFDNDYMKQENNCYGDCCCYSRVSERYLIYLKKNNSNDNIDHFNIIAP